jgi:hypothetical protein
MTPRRVSGPAVVLVVLAALLLSGCGAVRAVTRTQRALAAAGIDDPSVGFVSENGADIVTVKYRPTSIESIQSESLRAAQVVWRVAPVRFDAVRTIARGGPSYHYSRSALASQFGPRAAELDKDPADLLNLHGIVVGGIVLLLVGAVAIALIIVLVLRTRRRRTPAYAGAGWPQPPGAGWQPSPPPGAGWQPSPPPGAGWQPSPPPGAGWPQAPSAPPPPGAWGAPPAPPPWSPAADPNDPWAAPPR